MPSGGRPWAAARDSLPPCWQAVLGAEFDAPYMRALEASVAAGRAAGKAIHPADGLVFAALARTPLSSVRALVLGQDPYHGPGQATGLSFSVPRGAAIPPSLRNIHRELAADLGIPLPGHGCLDAWAEQGVLLLNATLTVEEGRAGSHARLGWHGFTDRVIAALDARTAPVAFVLWGNDARRKSAMLDATRHLVHQSGHPSPLSAYRGFFGSRPFSKVNAFLEGRGIAPIDWRLG